MSTELKERLFIFDGDDADYISYLEYKLLQAQGTNSTRDLAPSLLPSDDSSSESGLSPLMDDCRFIYCSPSRKTSRTPIRKDQSLSSQIAYLARGQWKQNHSRLPQWRREMNRFTESIPYRETWAAKRASCGFASSESNYLALRLMLGSSVSVIHSSDDTNMDDTLLVSFDNSDMVERGCKYGRLANHCTSNGRFAILVGKYQKLIFICYCTVLLASGESKTTVNWMMRQYISDSDDKNLERYRLGCLWVNRCISSLLGLGWGYKSWELFLICAQAPHQYGRFSDNNESIKVFTDAVGSAEVPIFEDGWIPYCIPCIIKCLAGDSIDLSLICVCLGYDFDLISVIYRTFFNPFDRNGDILVHVESGF